MGAKNKKNKKVKNVEHAASGDVNNGSEVKTTKKKSKKSIEVLENDPPAEPVVSKKSKKRLQDPVESEMSPKKKKKNVEKVEVAEDPSPSPDRPKKKKNKVKPSGDDATNDKSDQSPDKPKKKKKEVTEEATNDESTESPKKKKKKIVDESKPDDNDADDQQEEKKLAYDHADEKKTVFCGNIPNETGVNQTTIKNLFAQYGKIKTVRMRSETGNVLFSKKNKKSCSSFNAYIVFENTEDAKKSIQLNGYKIKDSHLRVNMANDKSRAFQSKGTIFVGNLPFDATEKEVHELFESCGTINYVRIIPRKGICYVSFDKGGTSILNALKLNETEFMGRNIRVTRCETKQKQEKKKLYTRDPKTGRKIKLRVKKSHKLNEDLVRGRGLKPINNPIIKKIKNSQKAKFNRFTDSDQVSKKDLFRRGGKFDSDNRQMNRNKMKQKKAFYGSKIEGSDFSTKKSGVKKGKISKTSKEHKIIAKKLKSAAMRVTS